MKFASCTKADTVPTRFDWPADSRKHLQVRRWHGWRAPNASVKQWWFLRRRNACPGGRALRPVRRFRRYHRHAQQRVLYRNRQQLQSGTASLPTTGPTNNNIIREILGADDTIHTVAGKQGVFGADNNVAAVGAAINEPKGLSVDAAGNIFFADQVNHVIREVPKATGVIGVVAGHLGANNSGYAGDGNPCGFSSGFPDVSLWHLS